MQFDLEFDSSKIRVDDVSEGRFLSSKSAFTFFNYGNTDNNAGTLSDVYGVVLGPSSVLEPESFATITMSIKEQATSTSTISLKNVIISDPSGNSIDAVIKDTTLTISGGPQEVFYDSFEEGLVNWVQDRQNDWFRSSQRTTNGIYSAEIDGRAMDATLTSSTIDLQGKKNAKISFSWYIESGVDRGEYLAFDVSTDGGATWTEKATLKGNVDPENQWQYMNVELNDIDNLKLRFRGKMSNSREDANVDNVKVIAY